MFSSYAAADLLPVLFNAIPSFALVVDDDVRILEYNAAAEALLGHNKETVIRVRCGEALHCLHTHDAADGCGQGPSCKDCIVRNTVNEALCAGAIARRRCNLEIVRDGNLNQIPALVTASPFTCDGKRLVLLIIEDISEMVELHKILPICMKCKKIRTDDQYWTEVEFYFKRHWDLSFSHGYCPECLAIELEKIRKQPT